MEIVAAILLVFGSLLTLLAAVGLFRFHDLFTRMHAATKPATLALLLIVAGTALVMPQTNTVAKLLLVILLQFITAPVGAHLIGRAAFRAGAELVPGTYLDDASILLREGEPR
jgi:multicomponent Na+:H+ antiporter subunit G